MSQQPQPNYPPPPQPRPQGGQPYQQPPVPTGQQRSGCFWISIGSIGCVGVVLTVFVVALLLGVTSITNIFQGVLGGFNQPGQATVTSTQTIVTSIQPMGQLVSISVQLAKADIYVTFRSPGIIDPCSFGANHVAQGTIEAGIDLTAVQDDDVAYNPLTDTYTITLPAPQLTSCRVDFIRQYDRTSTLCAIDWDEARLVANYEALTSFRSDSLEGGILNRAANQAELVLGSLITAINPGSNVDFAFRESGEIIPPSCDPDLPAGWRFDSAANTWTPQ